MTLVVIGGVAAGMSAAARARTVDPQLEIVVFERGPDVSYGACGLPYLVEGRVREPERLVVHTPEYFRKERRIEVRTGARVAAIAHPRREVVLDSGERIRYDRLVIATGARCRRAGIAGAGAAHVFTLHTLEDGVRMRAFLRDRKPSCAVVIGAGYLGLEAADAVRRNGLAVTVLERSADVLGRADPALTDAVRRHLGRHRVELRTGVEVRSIEPGSVAGLPCGMVVVAAGFQPNTELAAEAGVETGPTGAIRTTERMETNLHGVFAAGDCAETMHLVTGRPAWIPLGTTANKTGRVAGANAAGRRERFAGIAGTSIVGVFGMAFAVTGLSVAQARAAGFQPVSARIEAPTRPRYYDPSATTVELVADRSSGRLLGASVVGEGAQGRIGVVATALHARMTVEEFGQLDLPYSPPFAPVWDPLLLAARQLGKEV